MTEREYVQTLRDAAEAYIDAVRKWGDGEPLENHRAALQRWESLRDKISPWTVVRTAEAWLEQDDIVREQKAALEMQEKGAAGGA